jgi:topoisomerase-4 subunit A
MMKRTAVKGITRDKEYNITKGTPDSKILYFSANPNGEAEVIKVYLKPRPRLKNTVLEIDFGDLVIKGRNSMGNILTKYAIHKIVLKEKGASTLGGRKIWFDEDVLRLNADKRGRYLGEFHGNDKLLVITKSGTYRITSYDLSNHFEDDLLLVEKYDSNKVFTAVYFDADQKFHYIKRFNPEPGEKPASFIGDNPESELKLLTTEKYPRIELSYGGRNEHRSNDIIDVDDFIAIKGSKARGKRLSTFEIKEINEIEPAQVEEADETEETPDDSETETTTTEFENLDDDQTEETSKDGSPVKKIPPPDDKSQMEFDW